MIRSEKRRQQKIARKAAKRRQPLPSAPFPPDQKTPTVEQSLSLAIQHHNAGDLSKAEGIYQKILQADPNQPVALHLLGVIAHQVGKNDIAVDLIGKALAINSDYAEAHNNLGLALKGLGKLDDAVSSCRKAVVIKPDYADAHYNLGNAFLEQRKLGDAVASYHKALAIRPELTEAHTNLGNAFKELGRFDDAFASYHKALAIKPDFTEAGRNFLAALLYVPGVSHEELFDEHLKFAERQTSSITRIADKFENDPIEDRRLRIGYVSSDLKNHPVGDHMHPLIANHDHEAFEIFCYADVAHPDEMTEWFQSSVQHWRSINRMSDEDVARMVRADKIDVLVILAGRFDSNRPLVSAYRAAPVQVNHLDVATSGLQEMDYFLTDDYLNPPETEQKFTEEIYRLPCFFQGAPIEASPPVGPLPADRAGRITFSSFNNPAKVSGEVLNLWARVLEAVPGSRLMLKYHRIYFVASLRNRILCEFEAAGISEDRILFPEPCDTKYEHLLSYGEIDIALDPFPFNGGTTTIQALSMGVPVIALIGNSNVSRNSATILRHAGLAKLVAATPDEYVACACDLAGDLARLRSLRQTLREQLTTSPMYDAPVYAQSVEKAYRDMWGRWCTQAKLA